MPLRSPLSERSAACSTRASPGSARFADDVALVGPRRRHRHAVTAIRSASSTAIACRAPSTSTVSGPPNGRALHDRDVALGEQPELGQVAQERRIRVGDAQDDRLVAAHQLGEHARGIGHQLELGGRDRVAVRIALGEAERSVDARLDLLGEVVLEAIRLGVHLVPAEPERLHQVELEQPVVADDLERDPLARRRQRGAVVALVLDQPERREPLEHAGRGRRADAELVRDRRRGRRAVAAELPDRFEVVLGRFREHASIIL